MLALTKVQKVMAVAAASPICDWPGLDECCIRIPEVIDGPKKNSKKKASKAVAMPDLVPLLEARKQLFSSFERYFDAFASLILFLRSAGRDVPKAFGIINWVGQGNKQGEGLLYPMSNMRNDKRI